jgi:glutamate/tyrosine decarboxylase-like PLP-dependent enzyme
MERSSVVVEESLDPEDWDSFRALAHQMVDDMLTYSQTVRDRPVWRPIPDAARQAMRQPLPSNPASPQDVYQEFCEEILPYPMGNIHPRFWGWVMGNGTPMGVMAEMLAATMNPNMGGGDHIANEVEAQVIEWMKTMMGFPAGASGLLVSGGSMANLTGLVVARNTKAGFDIRKEGLQSDHARLVLYGSTEMHSSLEKAVEVMGLGTNSLRQIPVNAEFQIDIPALEESIRSDRQAGFQPFCIVGNAGTVNTGAIDDLAKLAEICQRENLWFHVDGAFGALARLVPGTRGLLGGIEKADSLAFDLHKWMYMPFEVGCILVRREEDHRRAFSLTPEYLMHAQRGLAGGTHWFSDYGVQLTRGFRALKVWMSIKEHGIDKYGRVIQQNIKQAQYLAGLVEAAPELELVAPVPLNIVCFRYCADGYTEPELNLLNQELLIRLHESGVAAPSYTTLGGRYALRAAITNHRSRMEDFDLMINEVARIGRELVDARFGMESQTE